MIDRTLRQRFSGNAMKHLQREIELLNRNILTLGTMVEEALDRAVAAIERRSVDLARQVVEGDADIDEMEVEIEEECLKILALHQPVAIDLRLIVTVMKMNDELERAGDLAANLAERAAALAVLEPVEPPFDLPNMARITRRMVKQSLDALVNLDTDLAREVWRSDREVDAIHRGMYTCVKQAIRSHPEHLEAMMEYVSVSRMLERIADQATSIAKDIMYMVDGEIVRHRSKEFLDPPTPAPCPDSGGSEA